jgi:hypothetical protein
MRELGRGSYKYAEGGIISATRWATCAAQAACIQDIASQGRNQSSMSSIRGSVGMKECNLPIGQLETTTMQLNAN